VVISLDWLLSTGSSHWLPSSTEISRYRFESGSLRTLRIPSTAATDWAGLEFSTRSTTTDSTRLKELAFPNQTTSKPAERRAAVAFRATPETPPALRTSTLTRPSTTGWSTAEASARGADSSGSWRSITTPTTATKTEIPTTTSRINSFKDRSPGRPRNRRSPEKAADHAQ
jgi:hypothetical protein